LFVPLVEEGWLHEPATRMIAEAYLKPLLAQGIDTLVLGCTHYPLLSPLLAELAPNVVQIDCGEVAAIEAAKELGVDVASVTGTQLDAQVVREHVSVYLTDYTPAFQIIAKDFLGTPIEEPVRTTLGGLP
jgi:glutamate racemase